MGSAEVSPQMVFARFVRRAIDDAREERGWTVSDLASHTGVGRSTVFRWLAGDWQDYRTGQGAWLLCCLDLPVAAAFRALGLPAPARAAPSPDDAPVEADLRVILDRGWPTGGPRRGSTTSATSSATSPAVRYVGRDGRGPARRLTRGSGHVERELGGADHVRHPEVEAEPVAPRSARSARTTAPSTSSGSGCTQ
jgi:transcriptional regulator with XRE-family HTH domain